MNRKAVLFLAAVMTAGSTVSAAAAETFAPPSNPMALCGHGASVRMVIWEMAMLEM